MVYDVPVRGLVDSSDVEMLSPQQNGTDAEVKAC